MASSSGWRLNLGVDVTAAVGQHELVHVMPMAIEHRNPVVEWNGEQIPLVDIGTVFLQRPPLSAPFVGVVAYPRLEGKGVQFGAISLLALPARITVDDEQACDLPDQPVGWKEISISCFSLEGSPCPILDTPALFKSRLS